MCSLPGRSATVLLVIDVQNGVVWDAWNRDGVVSAIASLVDRARAEGIPVIWVQHNDEWMPIDGEYWNLVPELVPVDGEVRINKQYRSSFEATELELQLARLNAAHLMITGAQTNNCIRSTVYSALDRGYDVTLVEDAHTTSDDEWDNGKLSAQTVVDEQNRTLQNYELPGRSCRIAPASAAW